MKGDRRSRTVAEQLDRTVSIPWARVRLPPQQAAICGEEWDRVRQSAEIG